MTLGSRLGNANVSQPWSRQSPETATARWNAGPLDRDRRGLKHRAEKWMPVFGESDAKTEK